MTDLQIDPRRHLNINGSYNIRDLGGYKTLDGKVTRWKSFLRSDDLHLLPPSSQSTLLEYGLTTIVDLRRPDELKEKPNVFKNSPQVKYQNYDLAGDTENPTYPSEISNTSTSFTRVNFSLYYHWIDHRQGEICSILSTLASPDVRTGLFHCAAGKDRTGMIAAILLGIARVPIETIIEDYGLTARFLFEADRSKRIESGEDVSNYTWQDYRRLDCPPNEMLKVLQYIQTKYGGFEKYSRTIGLNDKQIKDLRNHLVE